MSWLFGDSLSGSNYKDPLGEAGAKFQKWTDPLAMIFGDKYVNLTSRKIPTEVNRSLSKITKPIDKVDQQINPMREITPGADATGKWVSNKPGSTIGAVVGAMFAAPALAGAMGGAGAGGAAGGSAGGSAFGGGGGLGGLFGGGGGAGIGGMGATGGAAAYGGGISSSVLPGILPGASGAGMAGAGGGAGAFGGAGMFGGALGTGSITGTSAPLFSNVGMLGSGGGGLFGGNGGPFSNLSTMQKGQLIQQGVNTMKPAPDAGTVNAGGQSGPGGYYMNKPTATVSDNDSNALLARLLMNRQYG